MQIAGLLFILTPSLLHAQSVDDEGYCVPPFHGDTYVGLKEVTLSGNPALARESDLKEYYINTYEETTLQTNLQYKIGATALSSMQGQSFATNVVVWIDWNNDKDFDDQGEEVARWMNKSGKLSQLQFTVPASAKLGKTRMRVYCDMTEEMNHPVPTPCGYEEFGQFKLGHHGEIEDYTINVAAGNNGNPKLDLQADLTAKVGLPFWSFVSATDPDGDEVYMDVLEKPDWLTWDDTVVSGKSGIYLTGTPKTTGVSTVKVLIVDTRGAQVQESFTINTVVAPKPTEPMLLSPAETASFTVGDEVEFRWSASKLQDGNVTYTIKLTVGAAPAEFIRNITDTVYRWRVPEFVSGSTSTKVFWSVVAADASEVTNSKESQRKNFTINKVAAGVARESGEDLLVSVYPNPVASTLFVNAAYDLASISLYDVSGTLQKHLALRSNEYQLPIDVSALPSGTYTLVATSVNGIRSVTSLQIVR